MTMHGALSGRRAGRALAVLAATALAALAAGAAPVQAAAEPVQTPTQTATFDLGDLDESGTGTFEQFDPSLGTLTSVEITAEVAMDFVVCVTNLSEAATSINTGNVSGTAPLEFAGEVVADTAGAMTVPAVELAASGGVDGCADWLEAGGDAGTPPAGANSTMTSGSDTDTWSTTLTSVAQLAPYVGTGTVPFAYSAASASDLSQPSEWTLVFLASGEGQASIRYTYLPDEIAPEKETNPPPKDNGDGEVGGVSEELPDTGGPPAWLVPLGAAMVLAGAGVVVTRRPHSA